MTHAESHRSIRAGERSEPLVAISGSVGQPDIEGDHLCAIFEATILDAIGKGNMALMRFKRIGTKVQDVFTVFTIIEVPIAFPKVGQIRRTTISRTKRSMAELRFRAIGVEKPFNGIFASLTTLVESKFFLLSLLANGL